MVKYLNGKIYKIVSSSTPKVYVGSTTKKYLSDRMYEHRNQFKKLGALYACTVREILQYPDADIILLENAPCNTKHELHARERYYIETLDCVNKLIPTRTPQEYRADHKTDMQQYYIKNKELYTERTRQYRVDNKVQIDERRSQPTICECGLAITLSNLRRHKSTTLHQKLINEKVKENEIVA
jgi:hypothetical protein